MVAGSSPVNPERVCSSIGRASMFSLRLSPNFKKFQISLQKIFDNQILQVAIDMRYFILQKNVRGSAPFLLQEDFNLSEGEASKVCLKTDIQRLVWYQTVSTLMLDVPLYEYLTTGCVKKSYFNLYLYNSLFDYSPVVNSG